MNLMSLSAVNISQANFVANSLEVNLPAIRYIECVLD